MNAISVCDGISAASQACVGLNYKFLLLSEIDKFPRSVVKQRWKAVDQRKYKPHHAAADRPVLWGDFTALRPRHVRRFHGHADVDVLFGGTPCQSFSIAGKRAGLDDPRGDLSLEYALLAFRLGVRWFLWENVPGVLSSAKGEDFATILSAFTGRMVEVPREGWQTAGIIPAAGSGQFGVAWRTFDAQYAGVPQRRRRVFVVGYLGDHRRATAVLFDLYSLQGHPAPRREAGKGVAHGVEVGPSGGRFTECAPTLDARCKDGFIRNQIGTGVLTHCADVAPTLNAHFGDKQGLEDQHINGGAGMFIAHALRAEGFDASEDGTGRGTSVVPIAIQGAAHRENASSGPDGVGIRTDGMAYTLEARSEVQAVMTLAIRGRNGESTLEVREDGTANAVLTPNGGRAGIGVGAVAFDTTQITSVANRSNPKPGDPCHPLAAGAHPPAVGFYANDSGNDAACEVSPTLRSMSGGGGNHPALSVGMAVRRLTPRECERLQGFPDDYTLVTHRGKPSADGPRYKALGNSWAVPCARWIVERMEIVDKL